MEKSNQEYKEQAALGRKEGEKDTANRQNIWFSIGVVSLVLLSMLVFNLIRGSGGRVFKSNTISALPESERSFTTNVSTKVEAELLNQVLKKEVEIPVFWGDLGKELVEKGVIDKKKFEEIYASRGGLTDEQKKILYGGYTGNIVVTQENSEFWLNILWAFGLANKNEILEQGPMQKSGDAGRFASTGGWTLANGNAMEHFSKYQLVDLSSEQQKLVERVSKNIYRPCCDNPTYFPDCNHGMAMLGLLELMAASNVSEEEMYRIALLVNSYWFPDTYLTIAKYYQDKGVSWDQVDPKTVLGYKFSSGSGYAHLLEEVEPVFFEKGGSCSV